MKVKDFLAVEEPDMSKHQYYRGVRSGVLPVIQIGPSKGYMMTRELWRKFKRGESIDSRFFLKIDTA
jgi:hypothetical protein